MVRHVHDQLARWRDIHTRTGREAAGIRVATPRSCSHLFRLHVCEWAMRLWETRVVEVYPVQVEFLVRERIDNRAGSAAADQIQGSVEIAFAHKVEHLVLTGTAGRPVHTAGIEGVLAKATDFEPC